MSEMVETRRVVYLAGPGQKTVTLYSSLLGTPVEVLAARYVGSVTSAHGVYGVAGECDAAGADDCPCGGWTFVSPTTGVKLQHVRGDSWETL